MKQFLCGKVVNDSKSHCTLTLKVFFVSVSNPFVVNSIKNDFTLLGVQKENDNNSVK